MSQPGPILCSSLLHTSSGRFNYRRDQFTFSRRRHKPSARSGTRSEPRALSGTLNWRPFTCSNLNLNLLHIIHLLLRTMYTGIHAQ